MTERWPDFKQMAYDQAREFDEERHYLKVANKNANKALQDKCDELNRFAKEYHEQRNAFYMSRVDVETDYIRKDSILDYVEVCPECSGCGQISTPSAAGGYITNECKNCEYKGKGKGITLLEEK